MAANLENSAMATGLENVSFHFNLKEWQCQRMFKLLYNCTHFTCQHGNTHNPSSQPSIVCVPSTTRCMDWIQKRQRNQRSNYQHLLDQRESKGIPEKSYFCFTDYAKAFVWITTNCGKYFKRWEYQTTCLLRNLYAGQEATVRTGHGTMDWFQIGKGVY